MDQLLLFVAVGFLAQLVDGAIGMAYGLVATSVLIAMGTPPAVASASIHAAEVFTTAASGHAHWRAGNVDTRLALRLAVPGMAGGIAGALLAAFLPGELIRPLVSLYLLVMGGVILRRALRTAPTAPRRVRVVPLGLAGGFLDAAGGGGWGPLVASTLIGSGKVPRLAIGSTNAAEFAVTCAVTLAFLSAIGLDLWPAILGLVIGGVIAAPLAARVTRLLPDRPLMAAVGVVLILLALRNLAVALG